LSDLSGSGGAEACCVILGTLRVVLTDKKIKEMVNEFVQRAVRVHDDGAQKFLNEMSESEKLVAGDRENLFPGVFFSNDKRPRRMVDTTDGVLRCIRCNWEVFPL
jgi:hypothetical protein